MSESVNKDYDIVSDSAISVSKSMGPSGIETAVMVRNPKGETFLTYPSGDTCPICGSGGSRNFKVFHYEVYETETGTMCRTMYAQFCQPCYQSIHNFWARSGGFNVDYSYDVANHGAYSHVTIVDESMIAEEMEIRFLCTIERAINIVGENSC